MHLPKDVFSVLCAVIAFAAFPFLDCEFVVEILTNADGLGFG